MIWSKEEKLEKNDILEFFDKYISSRERGELLRYSQYYGRDNVEITKRYKDRMKRHKTPNNFVPSGYYHTLIDTMAGYMFQNIQYTSENKENNYVEKLNQLLKNNDSDVKDMQTGTRALIYNKAIELVYTIGDGTSTEIKYQTFSPENWILIYTADIEPVVFCAIRYYESLDKDHDYYLDVIYKDEWQYWQMKNKDMSIRLESRKLYFEEVPIVCYNTELIGNESSFDLIIPYIDALDFILTGNSNEIDRLVDALLVLGKIIKDDDLKHMDEWKILENMKTEDRAEYITKNMSSDFRQYVSSLLINEIHKHSHVIDWYSPDTGLTGEVSAKALITRLFDMDMFSRRIEAIYKKALYKRIRLINQLLQIKGVKADDDIKIILNRTLPSGIEDKLAILQNVTFISDQTKCELAGVDWETEKQRKEDEMDLAFKQGVQLEGEEEATNEKSSDVGDNKK
jgi:SPP1 family phage portal protein